MTTYCYCSTALDGFFPFEDCEDVVDAMHDVIVGGQYGAGARSQHRATLVDVKDAYTAMMTTFHLKLKNDNKKTLAELTGNETLWRHFWAFPVQASLGAAPLAIENVVGASSVDTSIAELKREMDEVKRANRGLQSQLDRRLQAVGGGRPAGADFRDGNGAARGYEQARFGDGRRAERSRSPVRGRGRGRNR